MLPNLLLPLVSVALGVSAPAPAPGAEGGAPVSIASPASIASPVSIASPRTAAVELAVTLSDADAIHTIAARGGGTVAFTLDRDGESYEVTATYARRGRRGGEVTSLSIVDVGPAAGGLGSLTWLGAELGDATAVTRLAVDADGAVTLTTADGRAYMAIPGRGSGGANAAVESRWAAAWDHDAG